jgi:hypothetical protein
MDANSNRVNETEERAKAQAQAQLAAIEEMVMCMQRANAGIEESSTADQGDIEVWQQHTAFEEALDDILASALSVEVRTDWHGVGSVEACKPTHYKILLCWGGPAVQIVGTLDGFNVPDSAMLQYQDWFTEWTNYPLTDAEEETLMKYTQQFPFDQ